MYVAAAATAKRIPAVEIEPPWRTSTMSAKAAEGERQRQPDPPPHRLMEDIARPKRDEERGEVLDEQRDPDREPVDRQEVEPLHEREPAHPEHEQERQLLQGHLQPPRPGDGEYQHQPEERPGRPDLGQPERRDARVEDHLRDGAVDGPEDSRGRSHGVSELRAPVCRRLDVEVCLAHGTRPGYGSDRDGRSRARWGRGFRSRAATRAARAAAG